jgi:hypothetical protein
MTGIDQHNRRCDGQMVLSARERQRASAMRVAFVCWRSGVRRSWRQAAALALLGGLLGAVALGAVAGARRTATAYGRYLASINASDVYVNVPGRLPGMPVMQPITLISSLPGVISHATYVGLNAFPVIHGRVYHSFLTASVNGSLDGEYFTQDRMTVLAGRLPPLESTATVVLTPAVARMFGAGVGSTVSYLYQPLGAQGQSTGKPFTRSYRVAAIVDVPPALVDESDSVEGSILPPGATRQLLAREYFYAWIGLRLARGTAGTAELQQRLAAMAARLQGQERQATHHGISGLSFTVNRPDVARHQVQQAIMPEAVALSVFGAIAALAALVLVGQGLTQMISRSGADIAVIRALGASRGQAALTAALPGVIPVAGGTVLAAAGAVALSPLAPVGPVRRFDPSRGFDADGLVLGAGAGILCAALLGLLAVLAVRSVRQRGAVAGRASATARAAAAAGLPASAVVGTRNALEPGSGPRSVPVRSALLGSVAAVTAVVTAVVFDASLGGLASHPARYGWNWDVVIQTQAGYGSFTPGIMGQLLRGQSAVAGWSEFSFTQLPIDGRVVPVLGIRRDLGSVQPPTTSGRPLSGPGQIELGTVTLRQLGKKAGDSVRIGVPPYARTVKIVGTVTLPSFGVGGADHVSLGRGAMVPQSTLLASVGVSGGPRSNAQSVQVFPSAVAIDLAPGTSAGQRDALVHRIVSAEPDGVPGGSYQLRHASLGGNQHRAPGRPAACARRRPRCGGGAVARPDRAEPGPPAPSGTSAAQGAGHDPRTGHGRHRLADHAHAADRGGHRRAAGNHRRPAGLARLRRLSGCRAGRRGPGAGAHRCAGRARAGRQPAGRRARGGRGPDTARRRVAGRVARETARPGVAFA